MSERNRELPALIGFIVLAAMAGVVGNLLGTPGEWYASLRKPAINPPGWVFGPVWTTLYVMIGVAGWQVWRRRAEAVIRPAMIAWGIQLALNAVWTGIFFGLHSPTWAFIEICFLWGAISATIRLFQPISRSAAWLMLPYLFWVTFAAVLTFAIWRLN